MQSVECCGLQEINVSAYKIVIFFSPKYFLLFVFNNEAFLHVFFCVFSMY